MRLHSSAGVCNTEGNDSRKVHAEQESNPSLPALVSWPAVISPSISVLLFLFHHSGKLVMPYDHLFLLLHIMHPVLFKLILSQGGLIIYGDIRIVFWWLPIDENLHLSFLSRVDLPSVQNRFVVIYFRPSVSKRCTLPVTTIRIVLRHCYWQVNTFRDIGVFH